VRTARLTANRLFLLACAAWMIGLFAFSHGSTGYIYLNIYTAQLWAEDEGSEKSDSSPTPPPDQGSSTGPGSSGKADIQSDVPSSSQSSEALPGDTGEKAETKIDPADKMFCEAHMKLARRHFKAGNLDRAKEELDQVIERLGSHAEARFMRAVTAAKSKDYMDAWRHISIAEQSAPGHPRIKEFVARLEKVLPRPSVIADDVAVRPAATHASELLGDALESLFANKSASGKLVAIGCNGMSESAGKPIAILVFEASAPLDADPIKSSLKESLKGEIRDVKTASGGSSLEITVEVPGLPLLNPSAKPVSSLGELLKSTSEETDVALKNSSESEPDVNKRVTGTYTIVAAGLRNVNDFMRKLSSQAVDCRIVHLTNTTMNAQNVWKGDVSFRFVAP